jgi:hypothetical protein
MSTKNRDDFDRKVTDALAKRASFICSNPDCRSLTVCPSDVDVEKYIYVGKGAHITAAASGGPRYDSSLTSEQRQSIENGIFLCSTCADMIDKNNGLDFTVEQLKTWKADHEKWVRSNLNKSVTSLISIIEGEHHAKGKGEVTGIDAREAVLFKPGTISTAEGEGIVTATRIAYRKGE